MALTVLSTNILT